MTPAITPVFLGTVVIRTKYVNWKVKSGSPGKNNIVVLIPIYSDALLIGLELIRKVWSCK